MAAREPFRICHRFQAHWAIVLIAKVHTRVDGPSGTRTRAGHAPLLFFACLASARLDTSGRDRRPHRCGWQLQPHLRQPHLRRGRTACRSARATDAWRATARSVGLGRLQFSLTLDGLTFCFVGLVRGLLAGL